MSDFFEELESKKTTNPRSWDTRPRPQTQTQKTEEPVYTTTEKPTRSWDTRTQTQTYKEVIEPIKEKEDWRNKMRNMLDITLSDEEYQMLTPAIAAAEDPEEEAYKWGCAYKFAKQYNTSLEDAYRNIEFYRQQVWKGSDAVPYKTVWTAIGDAWKQGCNTFDQADYGLRLEDAEKSGNYEEANKMREAIRLLAEENALLEDNVNRGILEPIKFGAKIAPFSLVTGGAGFLGNLIAPGLGTALSFGISANVTKGQEYIVMRDEGGSVEGSSIGSTIVGLISGAVETSLGSEKLWGKLGSKLAGRAVDETAKKTVLKQFTKNLETKFHFSGGAKLALKFGEGLVKNGFGEGAEEFWEEITTRAGEDFLSLFEGYDIEDHTLKSAVEDFTNAFLGGVAGSVVLGIPGVALNTAIDIKLYGDIKNKAETVHSEQMFYEDVKDNPVFDVIEEEDRKKEVISDIYKAAEKKRTEVWKDEAGDLKTAAEDIAELNKANEGYEEVIEDEETGETNLKDVYREESGELYVNNVREEDGTRGSFRVGDPEQKTKNLYGNVEYEVDEKNNRVKITEFSMNTPRANLTLEVYDQFAQEFPGMEIVWDPKSKGGKALKEILINHNPMGKDEGLKYYTEETLLDKQTRAELTKQAIEQTNIPEAQIPQFVAFTETLAKTNGYTLTDLLEKSFTRKESGEIEVLRAVDDRLENKANESGRTFEGMKIKGLDEEGNIQFFNSSKGVTLEKNFKNIIYVGKNGDVGTLCHEMLHAITPFMNEEFTAEAEKLLGKSSSEWKNEEYEQLATWLEEYLAQGKTDNPQAKTLLDKLSQSLCAIVDYLKKWLGDELSPEIRAFYDRMLSGDDQILNNAMQALEQQQKGRAAEARRLYDIKKQEELDKQQEKINKQENIKEETKENKTEKKETSQAEHVENQLDKTLLSNEQKQKVAEVINDPTSTLIDKTKAIQFATDEEIDLEEGFYQILPDIVLESLKQKNLTNNEKLEIERLTRTQYRDAIEGGIKNGSITIEEGDSIDRYLKRRTQWQNTKSGYMYETDDLKATYHFKNYSEEFLFNTITKKPQQIVNVTSSGNYKISDIITNPDLDKLLPFVKDATVKFVNNNTDALFEINEKDNSIVYNIGRMAINSDNEELRLTPEKLRGILQEGISTYIFEKAGVDLKGPTGKIARAEAFIKKIIAKDPDAIQEILKYGTDEAKKELKEALLENFTLAPILSGIRAMKNDNFKPGESYAKNYLFEEIENAYLKRRENGIDNLIDNLQEYLLEMNEDKTIEEILSGTEGTEEEIIHRYFQDCEVSKEEAYEYLKSLPAEESERIKNNLERLEGTGWAKQALVSLNTRSDMLKLINNEEVSEDSIFNKDKVEKAKEAVSKGLNGMLEYLADKDTPILGSAAKPVNAISASLLNCNPSRECANYCYATKGNYIYASPIIKGEIVNYVIEKAPDKAAEIAANQYKGTPQYIFGKAALRLFDKGDINEHWLNFIELMNSKGVSMQIFSKRPEILKKVDAKKNIVLLSIDKSNEELADQYPELPIALVYSGREDLPFLEANKERFEKHGGVILPIKIGNKILSKEEIEALPAWTNSYTCPIDKGIKKIGKAENEWNCTKCDKFGHGCFFREKVNLDTPNQLNDVNKGVVKNSYERIKEQAAGLGLSGDQLRQLYAIVDSVSTKVLAFNDIETEDGSLTRIKERTGLFGQSEERRDRSEQGRLDNKGIDFLDNPENSLFQTIGENGARNLDNYDKHFSPEDKQQEVITRLNNLETARQMEKAGKSKKDIKLATAWERGKDNKWKYELTEVGNITYKPASKEARAKAQRLWTEKLSHVLDYPDLFRAYPQLNNVTVKVWNFSNDTTLKGRYLKEENTIELKPVKDYNLVELSEQMSYLMHEIQHAIQGYEGFAEGGSATYYNKDLVLNEIKNKLSTAGWGANEETLMAWERIRKAEIILQERRYEEDPLKFMKTGSWLQYGPYSLSKNKEEKTEQVRKSIQRYISDSKEAIFNDPENRLRGESYTTKTDEELKDLIKEAKKTIKKYSQKASDFNYWQDKFATISNLSTFEVYRRLAGEVEARNVQARLGMTAEERRAKTLEETEDVARDQQIVMINAIMGNNAEGNALYQDAYHGTTADFEKFNTEKYGLSGEGSMSFGYGVYVSGESEIAKDYAARQFSQKYETLAKELRIDSLKERIEEDTKKLEVFESKEKFAAEKEEAKRIQRQAIEEAAAEGKATAWREKVYSGIDDMYTEEKRLQYIKSYKNSIEESKNEIAKLEKEVADAKEKIKSGEADRHLYTVEIPDNGYIKWDKTVPKATRERIIDKLYKKLIKEDYKGAEKELLYDLKPMIETPLTGQDIYQNIWTYLGSDKEASKFLYSIGYNGIDYPAGTNYGTDIENARNYTIFNDDDAKIIENLLFQDLDDLYNDARSYATWQEFMDAYQTDFSPEAFTDPSYHNQVPGNADAQWYQSTWEMARNLKTEESLNEEEVNEKYKKDGAGEAAKDALFTTQMEADQEMLDEFMLRVAEIEATDLDGEDWRNVEDAEDAAERDRIQKLQDYIETQLTHGNWLSNAQRLRRGDELTAGARKRILGLMRANPRAYRAIYAEIMEDESWRVPEDDTVGKQLEGKLKRYKLVSPNEDVERINPERMKKLANEVSNIEIAQKLKNGSLKMNNELDNYLKSLRKQINDQEKELNELEKQTQSDYQRIADQEKRDLLRLYDKLLAARGDQERATANIKRKIDKGLKISGKYKKDSQNLKANYDELFRKFKDLESVIRIDAEVQEAMNNRERLQTVKKDLEAQKKEESVLSEAKKLRIQLVKRTMRRVPFDRIDYENAKTLIAIQRLLEPNLMGGVNRWIGTQTPALRNVVTNVIIDNDYKEEIIEYLHNIKQTKGVMDFTALLEETKTIEQFNKWTEKQREAAARYLPKENWIRDLNLKQLAKEREESIDLDIEEKPYFTDMKDENGRPIIDKATGLPYRITAWKVEASPELAERVKAAVGIDMFNNIINRPFAEWTTNEMIELATMVNNLYVEGRDMLAAKKQEKIEAANKIRQMINDTVLNTGIVINDDDDDKTKQRKQVKIDKILGLNQDGIKGTDAAKDKGPIARINRLLHGYNDANVRRVGRILDNVGEGVNTNILYWKENTAYQAKQKSINDRAIRINQVMKENKITTEDLAKTVKIVANDAELEFTVDELLYFLAADKDYQTDPKKFAKNRGDPASLMNNDDSAATSRNAVMFGNMMSRNIDQELKAELERKDLEMQQRIDNDELTTEEKQALVLGYLDRKPGTSEYKSICKRRYHEVINAAEQLDPKFEALSKAVADDYAAQYERMNEVSIEEFNQPVHRVKSYVPLVRLESNGDTNANQVKEDLLGTMGGQNKQWVNKGMTQRRTTQGPIHQKPVQTGLYKTWSNSVERTEHFIAYAPYVRELNRIYKSRDAQYTRRFIESRYGNGMIRYLDDYINEVANPNANRVRNAGDDLLRTLRGKTAPAYLAWKLSGIIKQGATSPWPYMQFVNPAEYLAASWKLITSRGKGYEDIRAKSVFMNNRVMDPMNDLIEEMADNAKNKFDRAVGQFNKKGMAGLEWIDWVCVAPGWLACYEKEYARLNAESEAAYQAIKQRLTDENDSIDFNSPEHLSSEQIEQRAQQAMEADIEAKAVAYADDCTRLCQPSNRSVDIAPLFKNSSEAMKAYLQFQTSLNVIWQNLRYDLPYNIKNKMGWRIAGTIAGYVLAGVFMNSIMEGFDDDDDDDKKALKQAVYYATTQFTDSVPMIGSELTNTMDRVITGKGGFSNSGTDMTPTVTKILAIITNAQKGNWQKAADMTLEGIGMSLGLPVSGTKELKKIFGIGDKKEGLGIHLDNVYGIIGNITGGEEDK